MVITPVTGDFVMHLNILFVNIPELTSFYWFESLSVYLCFILVIMFFKVVGSHMLGALNLFD